MNADLVIDAAGCSMGRVASHAAKQSLLGKRVAIVNCESAIITGRREHTLKEYREAVSRGGAALRGPNIPKKNPEKIMKRSVRGMLSYRQGRGEDAFLRIRCYNGIPKELESTKRISLKREIKTKSITLKDITGEFK